MNSRITKVKQALSGYKEKAKQYSELTEEQKQHFENNALLSWPTYLYPEYEKSKRWYIGAIALISVLVIYGILTNSWTFSVGVLVTAGVYYYLHSQDNPVIPVIISDIGVRVGSRVYAYTEIKTFWIDYYPPLVQDLHLVLKTEFKQDVTIQLHGPNPTEIRKVLSAYMPEWEEREKNVTESIINIFGL